MEVDRPMNELRPGSKAQKTRDRVIKTSLELMEKNGYQSTTVRQICAKARVSIGTFYSYFPSKSDLFLDIYKTADDYFAQTVVVKLEGRNAKDRIVDFFRYYARLNIDTGIDLMRILYNPDNSWFSKTRPMQRVLAEIISGGFARGELKSEKPESEIVDYLFTLVRGCCYNWCIAAGGYDLEAQMTEFVTLALAAF